MKELTKAINDHLASEFQASHAYLAMSIWLREKDLAGFSQYMLAKSDEERGHAARMIAYLVDATKPSNCPRWKRRNAPGPRCRSCLTRWMRWRKA